ncbi:MAG: GNAT family N-acetyltransferase [Lachnospiraceae bacterium]
MIRQMTAGDLDGIAHIEKSCFGEPWSRELLVPLIDSRLDSCFVLEENGIILGYGVLRILAGEGEIMRIAVLPDSGPRVGRNYGCHGGFCQRTGSFRHDSGSAGEQ